MTNTLVYVTTEDGTTINTTENHPFYVEGKGWCAAAELEVGDICRTKDGQIEAVAGVVIEQQEEPVKVYNLTIEDNHTYYVSIDEVLVHNGCGNADITEMSPSDINYSQATINPRFDTPNGKVSVEKAIRQGPEQVEDFPPITVLEMKGQYVVRDGNSRLYIANETKAKQIKVIIESSLDAYSDLLKRLRRSGYDNQGSPKPPKH